MLIKDTVPGKQEETLFRALSQYLDCKGLRKTPQLLSYLFELQWKKDMKALFYRYFSSEEQNFKWVRQDRNFCLRDFDLAAGQKGEELQSREYLSCLIFEKRQAKYLILRALLIINPRIEATKIDLEKDFIGSQNLSEDKIRIQKELLQKFIQQVLKCEVMQRWDQFPDINFKLSMDI